MLTFSWLISEDFWGFLSFLSDRSVFVPSDRCAENTAIAGKSRNARNPHQLVRKRLIETATEIAVIRIAAISITSGLAFPTDPWKFVRKMHGGIQKCAGDWREICVGVHLHSLRRILGWGFRECARTNFAQFLDKIWMFSETKLHGRKISLAG